MQLLLLQWSGAFLSMDEKRVGLNMIMHLLMTANKIFKGGSIGVQTFASNIKALLRTR